MLASSIFKRLLNSSSSSPSSSANANGLVDLNSEQLSLVLELLDHLDPLTGHWNHEPVEHLPACPRRRVALLELGIASARQLHAKFQGVAKLREFAHLVALTHGANQDQVDLFRQVHQIANQELVRHEQLMLRYEDLVIERPLCPLLNMRANSAKFEVYSQVNKSLNEFAENVTRRDEIFDANFTLRNCQLITYFRRIETEIFGPMDHRRLLADIKHIFEICDLPTVGVNRIDHAILRVWPNHRDWS